MIKYLHKCKNVVNLPSKFWHVEQNHPHFVKFLSTLDPDEAMKFKEILK